MLKFFIALLFFSFAFAQNCPKDKSKAVTLYEKYCDPNASKEDKDDTNSNKQGMMRNYNDFQNAQSRSKMQPSSNINLPPNQSEPGYSLPKPFEVPSRKQNKEQSPNQSTNEKKSTWDYLN